MPSRLRRLATAGAVLAVAAGLSACSPYETLLPVDPSDGVTELLDNQIRATNMLVLTTAEGSPGTLIGSLTNLTEEATQVQVQVGAAAPVLVDVDASQTIYLTPKSVGYGTSTSFDFKVGAVDAPPGSTIGISIATPQRGSILVTAPVLDGTLEPYDQFLP
ncbi:MULTISPECIES: hypothetical protein [unclassified Pseudactinotalea]|uniref:hypothetical protein n=1 Tax=unclassified Pseudactinotalea TaxID=2649176 RepID=UPI00128D97D7|nr:MULTISPECIES: hypothetical protein [unclassified Pseudactinotalea]MPV48443.1 hypothetical protein [Pseudactinotalea sp. HY160]QGH68422.1 hypothetical protein GCE65_02045 [Pseudactinotalea sp. HY158]